MRQSSFPPSHALRMASLAACFLPLSLAATGCANLQTLAEDQCGNRVLEPDLGEDCDGEDDCGAPGTDAACRIVCTGARPGSACDRPGYQCGTDGVCRKPSGGFSTLEPGTTPIALDVFGGDPNSDGCNELILTTRQDVQITAFESREPGRCPAETQSLPFGQAPEKELTRSAPFLADVTGDGRPDLVRPGGAQFGDSLFVHVAGAPPELSPILYPTLSAKEAKARPFTVRFGQSDVLLLFLDSPTTMPGGPGGGGGGGGDTATVGIAGVLAAQNIPINLGAGLNGTLDDLAILARADLGVVHVPGRDDCVDCEEVLAGFAGGSVVLELSVHPAKTMMGMVEQDTMLLDMPQPVITLPQEVALRKHNASLAFIDADLDGNLDAVMNTEKSGTFIAYGTGKGTFHSTSPPDLDQPDGKASPFPGATAELEDPNMVFVAGDFDPATPGLEIQPIPCAPSPDLESAACGAIGGGCEVVVADIDRDGRPDIVSTEEQQAGLTVRRAVGSSGFQTSFIDTRCPAHDLTSGDFDDDGIEDVAYFDQVPVDTPGHVSRPTTTLMVAYGNAYAALAPPAESGRFEHAQGLTAGQYAGGGEGTKLYAAREIMDPELPSGFSLVEGYGERHLFAPFYFPPDPSAFSMQSLLRVHVPAAVGGNFGLDPNSDGGRPAVAVMTLDDIPDGAPMMGSPERLWLVDGQEGGGLLQAAHQGGKAPPACAECVIVPIDVLPEGKRDGFDELLFLGGTQAVLYSIETSVDPMSMMETRSFEESSTFETSHEISSVDSATNPPKHVPRPLVADLDGDGQTDIVLRSKDGALVAFWGTAGASFVEGELLAADECLGRCSVALLDVDGKEDGVRELVVVRPGSAVEAYQVTSARSLERVDLPAEVAALAPAADTDYTAAVAADFDGDGVDDLAIMNSASFLVALRAIPVNE